MACAIAAVLLGGAPSAWATTFYVSTEGSGSNSGTPEGNAFRTIQHAANLAGPGDHVIVKAGRYYERLKLSRSGEVGRPIVFEGERDANGNWLTIIDASDSIGGWVRDESKGFGVYRSDQVPYKVFWLGVENNGDLWDILRANTADYLGFGANAMDNWWVSRISVKFWDGFEALWYADKNANPGSAWVRFRNGESPSSKSLRVSNGDPVISTQGQSHVALRNFRIQGGLQGILISGAGSSGITIEGNDVTHGAEKIVLKQTSNVTIRHNRIHRKGLGTETYKPGE